MAMEVDAERLSLPGFGRPVTQMSVWTRHGEQKRLPHAIADWFGSSGITLRERRMLEFMNQVTDKPDWTRKVCDEEIVAKWKEEGVRWDERLPEIGDWWLSETMFEVCMQELREKAKVYEEKGLVAVLDAEATIVKSDCAVSAELRDKLRSAVRPLEDVPERLRDWHPGSDEKVLDLVHPSLFPVVYGLTKVLPTGTVPLDDCISYTGKGETTAEFGAEVFTRKVAWGETNVVEKGWGSFQWLPSHITFTSAGDPKISSYINNLHPRKHAALYPLLERFVDAAIPLWNECLSWYHSRLRIPIDTTGNEDYTLPEGLKFPRDEWREKMKEEYYEPDSDDSDKLDEEEMDDEEWASVYGCEEAYYEWRGQHRILVQPEPTYTPQADMRDMPGARPIDLKKDFARGGLQIIFKLASIYLTPDKPTYDGGSWHVEGSLNEHICATALYYYDSENVTDSRLAFRQSYDTEKMIMKPAQSEYDSALAYYGIQQEGSSILSLGHILTRPDRLLAFPNILQHQVQPFSLRDRSKPGHRKILAMFLIDPHIPILSTAHVPLQRKDWWAEEVRRIECFAGLPEELFEMIMAAVQEFPMSWDEAVQVRERLMGERGRVNDGIERRMEEDTFSFCEH